MLLVILIVSKHCGIIFLLVLHLSMIIIFVSVGISTLLEVRRGVEVLVSEVFMQGVFILISLLMVTV